LKENVYRYEYIIKERLTFILSGKPNFMLTQVSLSKEWECLIHKLQLYPNI